MKVGEDMKKVKKVLGSIFIFLLIMVGIFLIYVNDDSNAEDVALTALESDDLIQVVGEDPLYFSPKNKASKEVGIIFYPGGKVEYESYAPLMRQLAENGYSVFLVEMPFGLAVFDIDAAGDVMMEHPEVMEWYLAGHSLGGSMAAIFAGNDPNHVDGLILLAAYSTADLAETGLPVLSIYGSEDTVLSQESVEEYRSMLPVNYVEFIIEGGNHAQFGNYGEQDGDGEALISPLEQQQVTVEEVTRFIEQAELSPR